MTLELYLVACSLVASNLIWFIVDRELSHRIRNKGEDELCHLHQIACLKRTIRGLEREVREVHKGLKGIVRDANDVLNNS